ncbi:MAG: OmpH family outer membrane protein [Alphaproteobacteria bacterium]|nr:OmpH family outer membrane protein [Alphaproteobacteria bacterium]
MSKLENNNNARVNYGLVALVAIAAAVLSTLVTYKVIAGSGPKFAVVDVQRVVVSSKDVAALKNARDMQIQNLRKMADDANEEIKKEKDEVKKKELSEKYLQEINVKKEEFDKEYAAALQASDKTLNDVINSVANKEGMGVILNKASVVNGGADITDAVIEMVR